MRLPNAQEAERYEAQVTAMAKEARNWCVRHPEAVIKFQAPVDVAVICTLASALDNALVSANEHAKQMFSDLDWLREAPGAPAPTPFMVRMALEMSAGGNPS